MAASDFLTNIETAFLGLFATNTIVSSYNWQRWDSDKEVMLPRGILKIEGKRDPEGTPIYRLQVDIVFEGKPKRQKQSVVMNELKALLEAASTTDLESHAPGLIHFYGKAEAVTIRRAIEAGLRIWGISFAIYAVPML